MLNNINKFLKFFKLKKLQFNPFLFDIGTSILKIAIPDKGTLKFSTTIAYHLTKKEYIFYADKAKDLYGKLPKEIEIINPVFKGVIYNFDALFFLLEFILEEEILKNWKEFKIKLPFTKALVSIPYFSTEIEQRAMLEVLKKLGFNKVFGVFNLVALGYGISENFNEASPFIVVDIGAGKTEAGIITRGGIISSRESEITGNYLDEKIQNYLYLKYSMIIGKNTAEAIKNTILNFKDKDKNLIVKGKALDTGLPKQVKVSSTEIREALAVYFYRIIDMIKSLIEDSPPEIIEEVTRNGVYLTGGVAKIDGLDKFFKEEIKIPVYSIKDSNIIIKGLEKISYSPSDIFLSSI